MAESITVPADEETKSVHLVARSPLEMQAAQVDLQRWLMAKVASVEAEVIELKNATDTAVKNQWESKTLAGQLVRAGQRLTFYAKTLQAVEHGYCIIPNFPIDVFAVRVTRQKPSPNVSETKSEWVDPARELPSVEPQIKPVGEGHYVNPRPLVRRWSDPPRKDDSGNTFTKRFAMATKFDQVEFPIIAAQATIMDATSRAMDLRVFDSIGICPQSRPKGDPLIIGRIQMQKTGWQERKTVSFIIAWHLDLRTL